jgi:hypothetical protein
MRVGTWNLAGRWTDGHRQVILDQGCDVWLLTEVNERVELYEYHRHLSAATVNTR